MTKMTNDLNKPFQHRVGNWMMECLSNDVCRDSIERNHRFLEEALELVQANGCTTSEAHQLVDYVFNRPVGELKQEVGGVMATLAALCLAADVDMHECGEAELTRIWPLIQKIRDKQASKPRHSPLAEKKIDINDIAVGDRVILRTGMTGTVTNICEPTYDGIRAPIDKKELAQARIFIDITDGSAIFHTYRCDGISHFEAEGDIIKIIKAGAS